MGPFARIISSVAIASMALGAVSAGTVLASATAAEARSDSSNRSDRSDRSDDRGKSGDKSRGQNGKARGKGKGGGASPEVCRASLERLNGIEIYDIAVLAVQGARDALDRAAARLSDDQIPAPSASADAAEALIEDISSRPQDARTRAALRLLDLQLDYLLARDDLAAKENAQSEARQFASRGKAMSGIALSTLSESC